MDSFSRRVYVISHNSCPSTASGEPVSFVADMQSKWRSRIVGTSAVRIGGNLAPTFFIESTLTAYLTPNTCLSKPRLGYLVPNVNTHS